MRQISVLLFYCVHLLLACVFRSFWCCMDIPLDSPPPAPNDKCYKLTCRANEWFERHQYHEAITEYTKVIQQLTLTDANQQAFGALVYCNRSASYLHMRQYHAARDDAGRAIELRSSWGKVIKRVKCIY